tara:strand:- start:8091 stop:10520 length:2430 start_codon:yes stop_codon:yes gene_type:complete
MDKNSIGSEQLSFYKLFTDKNLRIEIPIIQRDYAQGRESQDEVRNDFLDALYGYLKSGKPHRDLDFIYGDVNEKGNLIPLDGQQRLTTLFLLHWYLALKEDGMYPSFYAMLSEEENSKFTYKTRQSSVDFANAILKNGLNLQNLLPPDKGLNNSISKNIKDSPWYFLSWEKDPTVKAMLCMLDAIHTKFADSEGFYAKLIDIENPVITFQFLELKDYGLTDDLYIKMNSRGKPLTRFENFKAKFEQHISNIAINSKQYLLDENVVDVKTYFSHQIDTKWTDLFWSYKHKIEIEIKGEKFIDYQIDELIMNLLSLLAINHKALTQNEIRHYIDNQSSLRFDFFKSLNKDYVFTTIDVLDYFCIKDGLKLLDVDNHYFNEIESFKRIINKDFSDAGYLERIQFFAYYSYLVQNKGTIDGLADWIRVIVNLSENTVPYNNDVEFVNSIRSINHLLEYSSHILVYLRTDDSKNIKGFNSSQIKEERIKSFLFDRDNQWKENILNFEKNKYFKGQLLFALAFSGIENYFDNHQNVKWNDEDNLSYKESFNSYIYKVYSLFGDKGLKPEGLEQHRLHRATLRKGNYLLYAKSNYSFLNDGDRDVSWKRLLLGDGGRDFQRDFFKQVLDDKDFDTNDLKSLERIASKPNTITKKWEETFINIPEIFKYFGSFKFIRLENDDNIFLVKSIKTSGEHAELFTYGLYCHLKNDYSFLSAIPFVKMDYYAPSGETETPCIYFEELIFEENNLKIDIFYDGKNEFKITFYDRNRNLLNTRFNNIIKQHKFIQIENWFETIVPQSKVKEALSAIFKDLSNFK